MKQVFVIFFLMVCPSICLSLHAGSSIILRGENCDYLYDVNAGKVWKGAETFQVEKWGKLEPAYYFANKKSIFRLQKGKITCSNSDWRLLVTDCLLPVPSSPESIQKMVHGGRLYLPVRSGFLIVDLDTHLEAFSAYPWQLQQTSGAGMEVPIPRLAAKSESLWVLDSGHLKRQVNGAWQDVTAVPEKDLIAAYLFPGKHFVNLLLHKVTQGDLGSFRTRVFSYSTGEGRLVMDREFGGVLKNPAVDTSGRLVFEYVKASILSALMGRNKVRLRIVDPGSGKVTTHSFSVGHKRRHLFFMKRSDGVLLTVVQCKNGNVFVIYPFSGKLSKLETGKFNYDYTFIRGVGSGVFYNEKTGNRVAVSFDPGSGDS
ncbi:MAG: hypothetical protein KAH24_07990 [Holophagae bacterium]|nr:hypothetical protein [Holophagae bacterium]